MPETPHSTDQKADWLFGVKGCGIGGLVGGVGGWVGGRMDGWGWGGWMDGWMEQ
jgi:hypothetical protein